MPSVLPQHARPSLALEVPPTFVYPTSRSKARPSTVTSPSSNTARMLKGKQRELTHRRSDLRLSPAGNSDQAGGSLSGRPRQFSASVTQLASFPSNPPTQRDTGSSLESNDQPPQSRLSLQVSSSQRPGLAAKSPSPSSPHPTSSPDSSTSTFVFPTSRSRAHPAAPPSFSPGFKFKGKRKEQSLKTHALLNGVTDNAEHDHTHSHFMGIPLHRSKKGRKSPVSPVSPRLRTRTPDVPDEETSIGTPSDAPQENHVQNGEDVNNSPDGHEWAKKHNLKFHSYPLDPYDSDLLESDRHTGELLRRLNPTNDPTFHNYGNNPPSTVLDLGCGQGHWVLDAAVAWKDFGTTVIGFDMVDVAKSVLPWAISKGVAENTRFVRGNFLQRRLPFPDGSFDLIRMSNLTLCISFQRWEFVLREISRLLRVGGRLELIDDHIFFPYATPPLTTHERTSFPARQERSVSVPPSPASQNRELGDVDADDRESEEQVEDRSEEQHPDAETLDEHSSESSNSQPETPALPAEVPISWDDQVASCKEMESLFEEVLNKIFCIHMCPSEFVLDLMDHVFGNANHVDSMHLMLASSDPHLESDATSADNAHGGSRNHSLPNMPGLLLWPWTFIPMSPSELEIHALKHVRTLLACKAALAEYIAAENINEDGSRDEEFAEAMSKYERFLSARFNPPQDVPEPQVEIFGRAEQATLRPTRNSAVSLSSMSTQAREDMIEYQSELHQRFDWPGERPESRLAVDEQENAPTPTATRFSNENEGDLDVDANPIQPSNLRHSVATNASPPYRRKEPTHVRTIHVYEAIKLGDDVVATAV